VAKFVPCGVHLPENKFQSLVGIDNIECATLERFYEILFQKNTEPFLFEFLIVRIRFIADGESDGHISGVVRYRTSSEPDSGSARCSLRGFRGL